MRLSRPLNVSTIMVETTVEDVFIVKYIPCHGRFVFCSSAQHERKPTKQKAPVKIHIAPVCRQALSPLTSVSSNGFTVLPLVLCTVGSVLRNMFHHATRNDLVGAYGKREGLFLSAETFLAAKVVSYLGDCPPSCLGHDRQRQVVLKSKQTPRQPTKRRNAYKLETPMRYAPGTASGTSKDDCLFERCINGLHTLPSGRNLTRSAICHLPLFGNTAS